MRDITGHIGRYALKNASHSGNFFALLFFLFRSLFSRETLNKALFRRITLEQIYFTAIQSLIIIIPIAFMIGSMLIIYFSKLSGQYNLGKTTVLLVIRELAPIITALLVILRSATAVTIEISYMNVLHEIEAIEMTGIDPVRIVCLPRLLGIIVSMVCLFIIFDLVSIIGGYYIVWFMTDIPLGNFLRQIGKAITIADIIVSIIKSICFGIVISVTCLDHGFREKRRITVVPVVTSRAAVECFFYCLIIDIVVSIMFYV
ncbi:MAG: ABC transporter permease [Desulfobacterales bacterium]|nr:ABC transporter permease [Desulfobacterales bacterium]